MCNLEARAPPLFLETARAGLDLNLSVFNNENISLSRQRSQDLDCHPRVQPCPSMLSRHFGCNSRFEKNEIDHQLQAYRFPAVFRVGKVAAGRAARQHSGPAHSLIPEENGKPHPVGLSVCRPVCTEHMQIRPDASVADE